MLPAADPAAHRSEVHQETQGVSVAQLVSATVERPKAAAPGRWYFDLSGQRSYLSGRKSFIFCTERPRRSGSGAASGMINFVTAQLFQGQIAYSQLLLDSHLDVQFPRVGCFYL